MREMQLLLMNGTRMHFTSHELRAQFWSRRILVLAFLLLIVVAIGNPVLFWTVPDVGARVSLWSVGILIYLAILPHWMSLCSRLWPSRAPFALPQPLVTILPVSALTFVAGIAYQYTHGFPNGHSFSLPIWAYLRNICFVLVAENIALLWLLPQARSAPPVQAPEDAQHFVQIGSTNLRVDEILTVKSAGHVLEITTVHGPQRLASAMKSLTSQVSDDHGVSPHRSYWVATHAVVRVAGSKMVLKDGRSVPVARGRREHVIKWARDRGVSHS
jgi:hypothetical protein